MVRSVCAVVFALSAAAAWAQPLELPGAQFNLPRLTVPETPDVPAAPAAPAAPVTPAAPTSPTPDAPVPLLELRLSSTSAQAPVAIPGTTLQRNAREGALAFTPLEGRLFATLTVEGRGIADASETCAVTIAGETGSEAGVALEPAPPIGRFARFRLAAPACPVVMTLVDDVAILSQPGECSFAAADCRVDPNGVWGPAPDALAFDPDRMARDLAAADDDVRAAFRTLVARSEGDALRAVLAEQAGFSTDRVTACARYEGEAGSGRCAARWTQARAAGLQARLGASAWSPAPGIVPAATGVSAPLSILPQDN